MVAAPAEAREVREALGSASGSEAAAGGGPWALELPGRGVHMVVTGVGKANAAAGLARVLDPSRHGAVLNIGVGGALPGGGAAVGALVAATMSVYADEGLQTPGGFMDCASLGFPLGPFSGSAIPADARLLELILPLADMAGPVATVSTCSGTDRLAAQVGARTGALAEAMEGAAIAQVAARLGVRSVEVRAISNTTGDRAAQRWDLGLALAAIGRLVSRLDWPQ